MNSFGFLLSKTTAIQAVTAAEKPQYEIHILLIYIYSWCQMSPPQHHATDCLIPSSVSSPFFPVILQCHLKSRNTFKKVFSIPHLCVRALTLHRANDSSGYKLFNTLNIVTEVFSHDYFFLFLVWSRLK